MIKELILLSPKLSIIILAFAVTLILTLITKKFTNQTRMKELKSKQKECQTKMKEHKGNPDKLNELQKELMSCSGEMMKHSLKPMLITMIPILFLFNWVRGIFVLTEIAKSWIWYYIISSMVSSIALRKILDVA
jgi:uncharacterized membrane protein (DUF106 family)